MPERTHHYLPQFHLRQFAISRRDGRIWTYDKQTDQMRPRPVRQVAGEPGYYTVRQPGRQPDESLEDLFGVMESASAPLVKRLAGLAPGACRERRWESLLVGNAFGVGHPTRIRAVGQLPYYRIKRT